MYARPLGLSTAAGAFALVLVFSGCEGDAPSDPGDGGRVDRPTATGGTGGGIGGNGSGGRGGSGGGTRTDAGQMPDGPPPTPSPNAAKILPNGTDLLGSFTNGCTFGPSGDRWCVVSRPFNLARRELWAVNVTKAGTAKTLVGTCNDPTTCLVLSSNLYTARPENGPQYPEDSARATGDSIVYLSDPTSSPSDAFQGDIWVRTIGGSTASTKIGKGVYDCAVLGKRYFDLGRRQTDKVVGICAGDPSSAPMDTVNFFTLSGGVVAGQGSAPPPADETAGLLKEITKIYPVHPTNNSSRSRLGFSADGELLVMSTGGATLGEVEKLSTLDLDTAGSAMPTPMPGADGATRWVISADGTKIFYLKEYNYNAMGNQSGTLWVADFPSGANARELKGSQVPSGMTNAVGAFRVLANLQGMDSGVGFLSALQMGQGSYSIIKNTAGSMDDVANVVNVTQRTRSLPIPSPNLSFSLFARQFPMDTPTSDIWVVGNNGMNECVLTSGELGGIFGFPFNRSSTIVFWVDNYEAATVSAEGWYTDPADCRNMAKKKSFSKNIDFWFVDGDRLLLYSDTSNGSTVTLKYAPINGATLGTPVTIQERADRFFQVVSDAQPSDGSPAKFKGVVYTLSGGNDAINGAYYYEIPAGGAQPPPVDAAAGN